MSLPKTVRIFLVCAGACLLAWVPFPSAAAAAGHTPGTDWHLSLGPYLATLEDPGGRLTISDVTSPDLERKFVPNSSKVLKLGLSRSVYWARFRPDPMLLPENPGGSALVLSVDKAMLESVKLFMALPGKSGPVCREIPLDQGPLFEHPPLACASYRFRLPRDIPPGAGFYLRFYSPDASLTIPVNLWSRTAIQAHQRDMSITLGLLYGVILAMCFYNFFIFLSLRDKTYFYYIFWMLGALGWLVGYNGHLMAYLPIGPWLGIKIYYACLGTAISSAILFTKSFLNTKEQTPLIDKILTALCVASLGVLLFGLLGFSHIASVVSRVLAPAGAPWVMSAAVISWRRGFKSARYLVFAWSVSLVGIICTALMVGGQLPHTTLTVNGWAIGTAIESIFLAFALSDRIGVLEQERKALKKAGHELHRLAITDELTTLYNARYLSGRLSDLASGEWRPGVPVSCIMLDLDDFKQINDTHGHPEGDKVLESIGQVIKGCIRDSDLGCRYGGEEFAVLLPGSDKEAARVVAERIRCSFAEQVIALHSGIELRVTLSAGVAELMAGEDPLQLLRRADEALYLAKRKGKNRTETAGEMLPPLSRSQAPPPPA